MLDVLDPLGKVLVAHWRTQIKRCERKHQHARGPGEKRATTDFILDGSMGRRFAKDRNLYHAPGAATLVPYPLWILEAKCSTAKYHPLDYTNDSSRRRTRRRRRRRSRSSHNTCGDQGRAVGFYFRARQSHTAGASTLVKQERKRDPR